MTARRALPVAAAVLVASGCGDGPSSHLTDRATAAQRAAGHVVYGAGARLGGLPLTQVVRDGAGVTLVYGSCHASDDTSCAPPLQISTASICALRLLRYPPFVQPASFRARGVTGRRFAEDHRLELATGGVVVSVAATRAPVARAALAALRPVGAGRVGGALPRPRYPDAYVAYLRRVRALARAGGVERVRRALHVSRRTARFRMALAREPEARVSGARCPSS